MCKTKTFKDRESGLNWSIRIVYHGDKYGLDNCLTNEPDNSGEGKGQTMIEFYDRRYPHCSTPRGKVLGQFVSRYGLKTLNETDWLKCGGLNLDGGVDDWGVGSGLMVKAMAWVNKND